MGGRRRRLRQHALRWRAPPLWPRTCWHAARDRPRVPCRSRPSERCAYTTVRQVRKCGCDLSKPDGYMQAIKKSTDDVNVALVFNNAGFITTGMFADVSIERHMANYECNATCALRITHHFLNKMLDSGTKGLIAFTSSPAGAMCSPFASIYGSTKAFLTEFAMSLAPEVKYNGIDVVVVHPSPVASNFYNSVHKISSIQMFQNTARGPENIVNYLLASAGRTVSIRPSLPATLRLPPPHLELAALHRQHSLERRSWRTLLPRTEELARACARKRRLTVQ